MLRLAPVVLALAPITLPLAALECDAEEPKPVTITVPAGERQTFRGFGGSIKAAWTRAYGNLSPSRRDVLSDALWDEANFNTLRVWFIMARYAPEPGERNLDAVFPDTLAQFVRDAEARGMKHLIVGPAGVPAYMRREDERRLRDDQFEAHAETIADFIADVRDEHGIVFEATGVQNEPNTGHDCHFTAEGMVRSVKLLREALDERGLEDVKIIAPETASADHVAHEMVDALQADDEAWDAIAGISTHSYNMAATERLARIALEHGKEYWQTESSAPGREDHAQDAHRASKAATTVLSDFNHGVTHWIYFIATASYDPRDNGTRVIGYNADETGDDWYTRYYKYHYLKQLANTFESGVVLRKPTSSLDRSMIWTYGRKPRVVAAVGRNADGSWAIGVSNYTSDDFPMNSDFQKANAGRPAETFEVTLEIAELAGSGEVPFTAIRGTAERPRVEEESVVAHDGVVTVTVRPFDLLTLRSAPSTTDAAP